MSNTIREYKPNDWRQDTLSLTAFVGGSGARSMIQFTIGHQYICLTQKELEDMMDVINKRIKCEEGYSATDSNDDYEYYTEFKVKW